VTGRLSPRRRLLFVAVAAVLVVALVGVGLAAARQGDKTKSNDGVAQDKPGPVLLVPGYGGGTGGLDQLAARLRAAGRQATVVHLPGDGTGDLNLQADVLAVAVQAALAGGASSVDVVGYSAGGVVARLWARDHGGAARARRIVTLGSPQHGTDLAAVAGLLVPDSCPRACKQLVPDSALLAGLNRGDETPAGPRWVSIWSSQDQVVTPPNSARLAGARNVVVQDICPGRSVNHGQLPTDAVVESLVVRALAAKPFATPTAADCAALSAPS
jgi:triacylglycerol esterase/lipase EstA (alpha/beta hydrolase family)